MFPHRAGRRDGRPFRARPLGHAAAVSLVLLGATASGTGYVSARAHGAGALVSSSASPATTATEEATVEPAAAASPVPVPPVDRDALLAEAVGDVPVGAGARLSVAVLDTGSGQSARFGDGTFDTASIVKADILAALLLRAQDAGRGLTAQERTYAAAMIRDSDNASATALWEAVGRAPGLAAANERLGLGATEGGDGLLWGLTQTTAADQLILLRQVFGNDNDSELDADSRAYLRGLMGDIAEGQDWGVSAAGPAGFALKNGWLPRSATGLWDINSVGRVVVDGRAYLVAVLSDGNSTKDEGIAMVEAVAKAAVSVFAAA
ncbi:hypothetical protein QFZ75_006245 [Streptomyces sp. V3I8]|uniref:serine hydrolase n=1 Tax=Streptomyces sp. V3I8 TaxID=3042279 RepID=UPI0027874DB2|nr:serine hydrolase [Streptomyces sp. V3I8]MDQ1039829.1 hypothetical protein [Streptomyces sp. V3I8]